MLTFPNNYNVYFSIFKNGKHILHFLNLYQLSCSLSLLNGQHLGEDIYKNSEYKYFFRTLVKYRIFYVIVNDFGES